jgi:hypothetical protein
MSETNNFAVSFEEAPHGDLSLDDIFGDPQPTAVTTTEPEQTPASQAQPFLKTATGTVYNSADDAVKGIEHKDQLIAELRQKLSSTNGVDPIKQPTGPKNYLDDKEGYFRDLSDAVATKNPERYMEIQSKFVLDNLAPIAPAITNLVKANAVEQVVVQVPKFKEFMASQDYHDTLDALPLLKGAIETTERNPAASDQLPQLYRMAYDISAARKIPDLVRQARPVETRPTVQSTPMSAPNTPNPSAQPDLSTPEGRKAIIAQQEKAGVLNLRW